MNLFFKQGDYLYSNHEDAVNFIDAPAEATLLVNIEGRYYFGKRTDATVQITPVTNPDVWRPLTGRELKIITIESMRIQATNDNKPYRPLPDTETYVEAHCGGWGLPAGKVLRGKVLAYCADWFWFATPDCDKPQTCRIDKVTFLTPDEHAKMEDKKRIAEIIGMAYNNGFDHHKAAELIVEAGYHKG